MIHSVFFCDSNIGYTFHVSYILLLIIPLEARNSIKRNIATKGIFLSAENINSWLELKFGRLQYDPYLIEYVRLFKSMLLAAEPEEVLVEFLGEILFRIIHIFFIIFCYLYTMSEIFCVYYVVRQLHMLGQRIFSSFYRGQRC